jgi:hypothetical protein
MAVKVMGELLEDPDPRVRLAAAAETRKARRCPIKEVDFRSLRPI